MRCQLASSPSPLGKIKQLALLVYLATCGDFVDGRGPDRLPALPIWDSSKLDCSLFRNELVLRPLFRVWPEDAGVRFHFCCEYQPGTTVLPSGFELSNYTYGPGGGTLQPVPYYDLGAVSNSTREQSSFWHHWTFWGLPKKRFSSSVLYCDATDMQALYFHRLLNAVKQGTISSSVVCVVLLLLVTFGKYMLLKLLRKEMTSDKEEVFSDICHLVMLSMAGSFFMEGIVHSPIQGWRSQLMFNMAVTYSYLTLFTSVSVIIRHLLSPDLGHVADWRWQKVFGQIAATGMLGAYLVLVEDVSGRSLDAPASLALATCTGASVWSGGVELVTIVRALWREGIKKHLGRCCGDASDDLPRVAQANQAHSAQPGEAQQNPLPQPQAASPVGDRACSSNARGEIDLMPRQADTSRRVTNLNGRANVLETSGSGTNLLQPNHSRSDDGS